MIIARLRPHVSESAPKIIPPAIEPNPYKTPISPIVLGESFAATARKVGYTSCVPCEKLMNAVIRITKNKNVGRKCASCRGHTGAASTAARDILFCAPASQTGDSGTRAST